jgi:hypothetical protein
MFPEKSAEDILGRWYQCYGAARLRLSNLKLVKKHVLENCAHGSNKKIGALIYSRG